MPPPVKPFLTYKWRWLSVQPSESLLQAPIFLGVLRALSRHEGDAFSSTQLRADLQRVQDDTNSPVTLARDSNRNLFRNSGQYWRGTGLIDQTPGMIQLTGLGRRVASGRITQSEFAALMVQQTELPNTATYSDDEIAKWRSAGLRIKPLQLILQIIDELGRRHGGRRSASLNNHELTKIVIPLAGSGASVSAIANDIALFRRGALNIAGWPDCTPGANDDRLAREFLLFLANFGLLRLDDAQGTRDEQRFYLDELFDVDAATAPIDVSIFDSDDSANLAVVEMRHSSLPSIIERQRRIAQTLVRTGQSRFRSRVLNAYNGCCLITGETIPQVLEAAHIIPVTNSGSDEENNGICMRVDIHRLYDSGNLRIAPDGVITLSEVAAGSVNYSLLPQSIVIPQFVNPANVAWRDAYL